MKYLLALCALVLFFSCSTKSQAVVDKETIVKYIADKKLNAVEGPQGLYYIIRTEGTGKTPSSASSVEVTYKGTLVDGTIFDESSNSILLKLTDVIKGWQLGLPLIKEQGAITLIVPSGLAYGSAAKGTIPANSVLIFDIALLSVF